MSTTLRPLGLGELLDRSIVFWRAHWKALFLLTLGFQLVQNILVVGAQNLSRWLFPLARDVAAIQRVPMEALRDLGGQLGLLSLAVLGSLAIAQVAGVALSWFAWQRITQRGEPTRGDAFRHAAARLGPTLGGWALSIGWTLLVSIPMMLPAIALGGGAAFAATRDSRVGAASLLVLAGGAAVLGTIVLVLWFVIRFMLLSQIIAIESPGAWAAFRRADALSSGRIAQGVMGLVKVRLTVLITVIGVVLTIVSLLALIPMTIAGAIWGAGFEPGRTVEDVVPAAVLLPIQLAQTVLSALVAPVYVMFQTWFYVDMRTRREGLDLELALGPEQPA
ncbi:MAG: hypothetical protein ACOZQL_43480 [Myxococcota bacterium]